MYSLEIIANPMGERGETMRMQQFLSRSMGLLLLPAATLLGLACYWAGGSSATELTRAVRSGELLRLHILADSDEDLINFLISLLPLLHQRQQQQRGRHPHPRQQHQQKQRQQRNQEVDKA